MANADGSLETQTAALSAQIVDLAEGGFTTPSWPLARTHQLGRCAISMRIGGMTIGVRESESESAPGDENGTQLGRQAM